MKKLAIITATRAEFWLLLPVIQALRVHESNNNFRVELIVTGTHLSEHYGMTINEIKSQNVRIDHEIIIPVKCDSSLDISRNQAEALIKLTELFAREKYNALIILGDRYEMLSAAIAANNTHTPIFHISGGDITEGALDDYIRHAITKMSYLHFTTNENSRKRVIQLGEEPERVFNYGSTSIDNILNIANLTKSQAMDSAGIINKNFALCTYHPVTLEEQEADSAAQIREILEALKLFRDIAFIFTKSNADKGGQVINNILDDAAKTITNLHVFASLGAKRYLSLMRYSLFVLGNSSSGIIEAPAFHVPTINIGSRQRGRLQSESVINCADNTTAIIQAINKALAPEFRELCKRVKSPCGDGHSAEKVANKILEVLNNNNIDLRKKFYNL